MALSTNPGIYNGSLFGTTNGGGVNDGTVYMLTPPTKKGAAWRFTLLYTFGTAGSQGLPDGLQPNSPLIIDENGVLYGATPNGGTGGCGVVFTVTPPAIAGGAWTYDTIYSLLGGKDGCHPWWSGVTFGTNGVLYGTTAYGGSLTANNGLGWGTVFQLAPPASPGGPWTESVVYAFTGRDDGGNPQANVLFSAARGVLYATSYSGGVVACGNIVTSGMVGCGAVVELTPRAGKPWKMSVLHTFTGGDDGGLSSSALVMKAGVLYGTTSQNNYYYDVNNDYDCPSNPGGWGCGTVFELAPPASAGAAWTETVLYHFLGSTNPPGYGTDANVPVGGVVFGPGGSLYGTTTFGGPFGRGAIFELAPPASPGGAWTETVLYTPAYDPATGGYTSFPAQPDAGLILGKNGVLYGTTTGDAGMIFQLKP